MIMILKGFGMADVWNRCCPLIYRVANTSQVLLARFASSGILLGFVWSVLFDFPPPPPKKNKQFLWSMKICHLNPWYMKGNYQCFISPRICESKMFLAKLGIHSEDFVLWLTPYFKKSCTNPIINHVIVQTSGKKRGEIIFQFFATPKMTAGYQLIKEVI